MLLASLRLLLFAAFASFLVTHPAAAADRAGALTFGVYPYLSPTQIVTQFKPLADHLAITLGRPVNLVSAPDFPTFIERNARGDYDLVFTAPHMGRLAERRHGYLPVAQTGYQIVVALVCLKETPLRGIEDLRGMPVAIGAKLSITYQVVAHALREKGIELGRDVPIILTASFSNVLETVLRGEAAVGAIPTAVLDNAAPGQRAMVRELFRTPPTPGGFVLAHPRLDAGTQAGIRDVLITLKAHPAGMRFLEQSKLVDFRPLDAATLARTDPYTAVFDAAPR